LFSSWRFSWPEHSAPPFYFTRYPADGRRKQDTVPITTRQLEALIRLSQARAKACLRDFVLKEDALDVVELMSKSVDQVHSDDHGSVDRSRGGAGGTSNRKMKKAFENELGRVIGSGGRCSLDDLVSDCRDGHVLITCLVLVLVLVLLTR
jgi:hypothetical protein